MSSPPVPGGRLDPAGFEAAFAAVSAPLLAWARLRVGAELRTLLDPEDLVQEVGCRALLQFGTFDPARGTFRQWLFGIANRVLLEALRELGKRPVRREVPADRSGLSDVVAAITTITRRVARDELVAAFLRRSEGLEAADRALLLHHGLEGLPHTQVAQLLGISEDAVRKRWQRLREQLCADPAFAALAPEA